MTKQDYQHRIGTYPTVLLFSMDADDRLRSCSPAWAEFAGGTPSDWPQAWLKDVHPEDRARVAKALEVGRREGIVVVRFRMRRADGNYRRVHLRATALRSAGSPLLSGMLTDITDGEGGQAPAPTTVEGSALAQAALRVLDERARRRSHAHVEERARDRLSVDALLASSPDAMALVDRAGRYVHVNDQMARFTGMPRLRLVGREVSDLHPALWDAIRTYFDDANSVSRPGMLDPDEFEVELTSGGQPFDFLGRVYPVNGKLGLLLGLGVSLTDITARKQAERAVREASALKDEFLSIASHELRNPVAAVRGSAQLMMRSHRRGTLTDARLETHLNAILQASEHLAALTGDLLDVSRLQRGQFPVRPQRVSLRALVEGTVADHAIRSRCRLDLGEGPALAMVDPARFEQILGNLLDNAMKYAPGDTPVHVALRPQDGGVLLKVRDQGIGMPRGVQDDIFKPFGRAQNAVAANLPGLGLGLYICRRIAEQHGGRLWAESDGEGTGTAMFAWFPRDRSTAQGSAP